METRIIQNLIQSYFDITKCRFADVIPKIIMANLVEKSKEQAQMQLVEKVYKGANVNELIVEDPMLKGKREACLKSIKSLKDAANLLQEINVYK